MSLLSDNGPFISELVFVFIIMSVLIGLLTYTDLVVHDRYLLHVGAECYEGNTSTFCQNINELHDCPQGGSACILEEYWLMLQVQMIVLGGLMMFIKLGLVKLFKRKITPLRIFSAFIYGAAPVLLLFFAVEDFLYFATRNQPVPDELPWLDHSPIMQNINTFLGTDTTTSLSLYVSMLIGGMAIIALFSLNTYMYKKNGLKTPV